MKEMNFKFSVLVFIASFTFLTTESFAQVAKVLKLTGVVLVDGKMFTGKAISNGSTIDTSSPNSVVDLSFNGKSFHRFKGGIAKLKITKSENKVDIDILAGEIFSYLIPGSRQKLHVNTKSIAMGVRGTKFYAKVTHDKAYLCVCEGKVEVSQIVQSKAKVGKNVVVNAGFDLSVENDLANLIPSKASDQMMSMSKEGFADFGFPIK